MAFIRFLVSRALIAVALIGFLAVLIYGREALIGRLDALALQVGLALP